MEDVLDSALLRQAMPARQGLVGIDTLFAVRPIASQIEGE